MTAQTQMANRTGSPAQDTHKQVEIGRVLSVGASKAMVSINKAVIRNNQLHMAQLGTILKIVTRDSLVVAMVSSLKIGGNDEEGLRDGCIAQLDILGEISTNKTTRQTKFFRGVRSFPVLNEAVYNMGAAELELIFNRESEPCIEVGKLQQDASIIAKVRTDDLLSKHFAIIGSTGSGKSCTVALVLQAILHTNRNAHVVLFDPHNEYSKSFGDLAEVIRGDTLNLPIWMFNFEETVALLASDIEDQAREEREVLYDVLLKAKQLYDRSLNSNDITAGAKIDDIEKDLARVAGHISLDSPVPYRIRDVLKLLDHYMGKLENSNNLGPYLRLMRRIKMFMGDPRYQFIFRNQAAPSPMSEILGRIFRIPVAGKPIAILDFSSIPSEALNIVVSVVSRMAFDLAMWSGRKIPVLLVCEEAHRYIPADPSLGFNSTRKIISRIAKEGRKYGVSLGIISQRPSELEPSTLSQCSTVFSMRLSNEHDQNFVRAAVPDGAAELLAFLPSLGTAESMVFGESVNMPMRVVLNTLAEEYRPHSSSAKFTQLWEEDSTSVSDMERILESWRSRSFNPSAEGSNSARTQAPQSAATIKRPSQVAPSAVSQARARSQAPGAAGMEQIMASRQRLQSAAPKAGQNAKQSLADVKRILNGAFNKDI